MKCNNHDTSRLHKCCIELTFPSRMLHSITIYDFSNHPGNIPPCVPFSCLQSMQFRRCFDIVLLPWHIFEHAVTWLSMTHNRQVQLDSIPSSRVAASDDQRTGFGGDPERHNMGLTYATPEHTTSPRKEELHPRLTSRALQPRGPRPADRGQHGRGRQRLQPPSLNRLTGPRQGVPTAPRGAT